VRSDEIAILVDRRNSCLAIRSEVGARLVVLLYSDIDCSIERGDLGGSRLLGSLLL
jgi:hypothetical protein